LSRLLKGLMRSTTALAILAGCGKPDVPPPTGPLAQLAVLPSDLPSSCQLRWESTPYTLATAPVEEREFFIQILKFWFGSDSIPSIGVLEAGLSNVYSSQRSDHALVSLSLRFTNPADATAALEKLRRRYAGEGRFSFQQKDRLVLAFSVQPEVPASCAEQVRAEVERRAAGAV
jgi:hypothetical protein